MAGYPITLRPAKARTLRSALGALALVVAPAPRAGGADTYGAEKEWYLRAIAAAAYFVPSATVTSGGQPVPGASVSLGHNYTGGVQGGFFFCHGLAVSIGIGVPPTTEVMGAGSLATAGRLGTATYAPAIARLEHHFRYFGLIQPYFGAGPTLLIVTSTSDGALTHLHIDSALGLAIVVGTTVMFDGHWGISAELNKVFVSTDASGNLGPAPSSAHLTLNPWIPSLGLNYRF
jgi:outer membrane protein